MAELIKPVNYREIAKVQQAEIRKLNDRLDGLKAVIIALFLAIIAVGVGSYMGYSQFKNDIQPKIDAQYSVEESYPVPVEQLKEI